MAKAKGAFQITSMGEDPYREFEGGPKLTRARGTQRFTGGIEGEGSVEWLMCYLPDGTARFVGHQRVTGSIGGRTGSFVVEAVGNHDGERSNGTWRVIAGTDQLSGLSGEGAFEAPGGPEASYTVEYEIG